MLHLFRKKKEWLKWTLVLVIFGLAVTTVFLFVGTPGPAGVGMGMQDIAVVAGESIKAPEFMNQYRQLFEVYRQMYNLDQQPREIVQQLGLPQQALNQLITEYAVSYEAQKMGLAVSSGEMIEQISSIPALQIEGQFVGVERYRQVLQANNLSPREFEEAVRRDIIRRKFREILTDGIQATAQEVRQDFLDKNQKVRVRYVMYDVDEIMAGSIEEEKLREYYDLNQEDFRLAERRKLKYLAVPLDPSAVEVTEEQIESALNSLPAQEQVRVRHLLIRSRDGDNNEEAARSRAQNLLDQIKAGADFAKLAEQHSDDTQTAVNGGDMGFFPRGQTVPEFEQVAFSLAPNEIHPELVRTPFGFHIIQTLEKTGGSREAMRPMAEFEARNREADRQARELARRIRDQLRDGRTLDEMAEEHSLKVSETAFVTSAEPLQGLVVGSDFRQSMFSEPAGSILEPYSTSTSYLIARIDAVEASRIPPFEDVSDQVETEYRAEEGDNLARQAAYEFIDAARQEGALEKAAAAADLPTITTGFFEKTSQNIDENLLFSEEIKNRAFQLPVGGISPPVRVRQKYIVFEVAEKSEVDEEKFAAERSELARQLTEQRRNEFFSAYIQKVMERLRQENQIEINTQLLEDLTS